MNITGSNINWEKISKKDGDKIQLIVQRARKLNPKVDKISMHMDISAAHLYFKRKLDLDRLLIFDDANFGHDVFGLSRYLNRSTGEVEDFFEPRCGFNK